MIAARLASEGIQGMRVRELIDFIRVTMRMSHVYQPLLIRTLVESGGAATVRQLARAFAAADDAQVRLYEKRIKDMPLPVLKKHGIVTVENGIVRLTANSLDFDAEADIIGACNQRISDFLAQRGPGAWSGMLETSPVSGTVRYEVLARDRTCRLCGATRDDAVLEVDHIVPRSKGGTNDMDNLQVLCRPCNQGKSNLDATDFT